VTLWDYGASRAIRCARRCPTWGRAARAPAAPSETQEGVLSLIFKVADDSGLLLLDLKDLRAVSSTSATTRAVQDAVRQRVVGVDRRDPARPAADRGAGRRPVLRRADARHPGLMQTRMVGASSTSSLRQADEQPAAVRELPAVALSELFENLPEVGDRDKPRLVFFFDEAHLLFNDAPTPGREGGAGGAADPLQGRRVYFVTQIRSDIPEKVLASSATACSTRCGRSRRATEGVKSVAETMRANPKLDAKRRFSNSRSRGAGVAARRQGQPASPARPGFWRRVRNWDRSRRTTAGS